MAMRNTIRNIAVGVPLIFIFGPPFVLWLLLIGLPVATFSHLKWKSNLRKQARYRNPKPRSVAFGTLIVDSPTTSGKNKYCWWTPDDIFSLSPHTVPSIVSREDLDFEPPPDQVQSEFDDWCYVNYLSPVTGSAVLFATWKGCRFAKNLMQNEPELKRVEVWSGPCFDELPESA